ncbi:MAG: ankyrin repeat domain-containing protein [Spirochaetales bacterium]|nr:ankyrin repeat domain-containing protein [Spirochaetales bacterium]
MQTAFNQGDNVKNRYLIIKNISSCNTGTTYLAKDNDTGNIVVLKLISLSQIHEWKNLELFKREAGVLRKIAHPLIPDYIDYFEMKKGKDTFYVLVQEYIEGGTLWNAINQKRRFTAQEVVSLFKNLLKILDYIHNMDPIVIHRDINPKNIVLGKNKKNYLVNFGAARITEHNQADGNTIVGSIGYSAQEQLYGRAAPASDLYSLAITIIFLLTGREPWDFQLKDMKPDYHPFVDISAKLRVVLDLMIEPELENRIQDAKTILEYLEDKKEAVAFIKKKAAELKLHVKQAPKDYLGIFRRREKRQKLVTVFSSGLVLAILLFIDLPLKGVYVKELYIFISLFLILMKIISIILVWNILKDFFFIELETTKSTKKKKVLKKASLIFVAGLILTFLEMLFIIPIYIFIAFSLISVLLLLETKKIKQMIFLIVFVPLFSWLGISAVHFFIWLLASYLIALCMCRGMKKLLKAVPAATLALIMLANISAYGMALESDDIKSEPETVFLFKLPYLAGADVNFRMEATILCAISESNKLEVAEYLINRGANISLRDISGDTPLHNAAGRGSSRMIELFIAKGAPLNAINYYGETPLHKAVVLNRTEAADCLIEHGADINKTDEFGSTLLHYAVRAEGNIESVQFLLQKGALTNIKDMDQKTPLDLALENKNQSAVELLTEYENR